MSSKRIVGIHQPNFFPWLGYFDKISKCDCFVFLDNVQLPRTGAGSWVNRVKLFIGPRVTWFTIPIKRPETHRYAISETRIAASHQYILRMRRSLEMTYKKSPFYSECMELIWPLLSHPEENIALYNMNVITTIAQALGIREKEFIKASLLPFDGEVSTARLVRITKEVKGTCYLYGAGAKASGGYQEDELFFKAGIALMPQNFIHPEYKQFNSREFYPGLSIIDALMNCGIAGTSKLLQIHS